MPDPNAGLSPELRELLEAGQELATLLAHAHEVSRLPGISPSAALSRWSSAVVLLRRAESARQRTGLEGELQDLRRFKENARRVLWSVKDKLDHALLGMQLAEMGVVDSKEVDRG